MKQRLIEFLYRFGLVKTETTYVTAKVAPTDQGVLEFNVGDWVLIHGWVGLIDDLALTHKGSIMVNVASFKGISRYHPTEWLQYEAGQIRLATKDEIDREFENYGRSMGVMAERMQELKRKDLLNGTKTE